jgi:hypothetical protein
MTEPEVDHRMRLAEQSLKAIELRLTRGTAREMAGLLDDLERGVEALAGLEAILSGLPEGAASLRPRIQALSNRTRMVAALMEQAAGFYTGWLRLAQAERGYTAGGKPVAWGGVSGGLEQCG